jgi:hypothetical protein
MPGLKSMSVLPLSSNTRSICRHWRLISLLKSCNHSEKMSPVNQAFLLRWVLQATITVIRSFAFLPPELFSP